MNHSANPVLHVLFLACLPILFTGVACAPAPTATPTLTTPSAIQTLPPTSSPATASTATLSSASSATPDANTTPARGVATRKPTPDYIASVNTQLDSAKMFDRLQSFRDDSKNWDRNAFGFGTNDNGSFFLEVKSNGAQQTKTYPSGVVPANRGFAIITKSDVVLPPSIPKSLTGFTIQAWADKDQPFARNIYVQNQFSPILKKQLTFLTFENYDSRNGSVVGYQM